MINIKSDSRKIKNNDIFVALKGISSNGDDYVPKAIENGASKIITESDNKYSVETIKVSDSRIYLENYLKDNYSKYLDEMTLIGITGTNGKTTTSYLIYQMLNKLNIKCAYIGTIGFYMEDKVCSLPNTSPDICDLYDLIITAYDNGYKTIVIEVSSQGLDMNRFNTIKFDYALFTNLTQDHLDYHKTMENYSIAKRKLFDSLKENGLSILNIDDDYNKLYVTKNTVYYGTGESDYNIRDIKLGFNTTYKLNTKSGDYIIKSNLIGKYNVYNLTLAIALVNKMGVDINKIINILDSVNAPNGRMDIVKYNSNIIAIDYAHTPDAMENIYNTIKEVSNGNIYTVFGCTGSRDRLKRPIMMKIACSNSKFAIVTSDDLHDEEFSQIISDMLKNNKYMNFEVIQDRGKAILKGINLLNKGDILLILGKGHEDFIIIKDKKIPFNDKEEVNKIINKIGVKI